MPPLSRPRRFPTPVPGGSLIGSIGSQFSNTHSQTLHQIDTLPLAHSQDVPGSPMPYTTNTSAYIPSRSVSCVIDADSKIFERKDGRKSVRLERVVQNLSRERVVSLAIQARIRQIPAESEEELRRIVVGAVSEGILKGHDIQTTCTNSFMSLPTDVRLHLTPTTVPQRFPLVACISLVPLIDRTRRSNFALHLTFPSEHEFSSSCE